MRCLLLGKYTELPSRAGAEGLPRRRSRRGKANSNSASALLLELKEHVKGMYHLTNGLDGLDVGFFLHENKVLFSNRDNDVVRVLVRRLKKRLSWESSSTPMHSSPTLPSCTSQPDSQVSLAPRTTCGSRGASKKIVWVHGLLQRVHPRLVGSSRENRNANFAFSQLALFGVYK